MEASEEIEECEGVKGVALELREREISADHYHADMDVNARERVHLRIRFQMFMDLDFAPKGIPKYTDDKFPTISPKIRER
ncbi:hypothetical protein CQW23_01111 [Capsicum baccatum]|uniref:Uncharacterized protein n=1 Tax=Capsicum baccatum TaxID=33114 RepID=A0A2G2XMM7_CAPBA|nr:hypothetical protein CQW23_01111 [Capsicum baccatum]